MPFLSGKWWGGGNSVAVSNHLKILKGEGLCTFILNTPPIIKIDFILIQFE